MSSRRVTHQMSHNDRSKPVTQGVERTPIAPCCARWASATAISRKPIIGVANGYSTITPCNAGLDDLAARSMEALRDAQTMPQIFGTITVSDGISMGTEGMKYSLVSREVIADSIETVCSAARVDGRAGHRRLRQEHARRHDRHRAAEYSRHLRLRRHHQAGPPGRERTSPSSARSKRSDNSARGESPK